MRKNPRSGVRYVQLGAAAMWIMSSELRKKHGDGVRSTGLEVCRESFKHKNLHRGKKLA